jgi:acylphosphatase
MSEVIARKVTCHGCVQGVGFRFHTASRAEQVGVHGWVRNEPDGSVRVHVEGTPLAVAQMIAWLETGPRWAHVTRVDTVAVKPQGLDSFVIRG